MDASQLTYERHSRAVYVNYRMRRLETEQRNLYGIPRPVESISPVGGDGPDYTNWYNYVLTGPLNIDDCTLACIPGMVPAVVPPPPPPPSPVLPGYTYMVLEDPVAHWTYRIYDVETGIWGDSIDTGYAITDVVGSQLTGLSNGFGLEFYIESPPSFIFKYLNIKGTVLQTFTFTSGNTNGQITNFLSPVLLSSYEGGILSVSLFNLATNTYSSPTPFNITTDSSNTYLYVLDNAGVFLLLGDITNVFYSWGVTQTEPSLVCTTTGDTNIAITSDQGLTFNNAIVLLINNTGTIRIFAQDGTVAKYETGITTYNSSNINFYGQGNLQMCYIDAFNTGTSRHDVYIFPFATTYPPNATFTPIKIEGLTNPQFTFKSHGSTLPTDGSNHLIIIDPIGSGNFIGGNVYVVCNGTQKLGPFYYNNSPNKIYALPILNNDGACLLVWNGSALYSQVITPSINVTTLLPHMTNDIYGGNNPSMFGYFLIYGGGGAEGNFFILVSSTTGAITYQNVSSNTGKTYTYSGNNNNGYNLIAYDNNNHTLLTFINGTIEEIPSWANSYWSIYMSPELANGTKFSINVVSAPHNSQILCMNSTGYVITTIPFATANLNNIDIYVSFYNTLTFNIMTPYVIIGVIDVDGNFYSYRNEALTGYYNYTFYITNNTFMWWLAPNSGTPQFYIGFNTDTNTFNTGFSDTGSDISMRTNYPFYVGS